MSEARPATSRPEDGYFNPEKPGYPHPLKLAGDIKELHRAVHEAIPDWDLYSREMRAILAALPIDGSFEKVCSALEIDYQEVEKHPVYESFKRIVRNFYQKRELPPYRHLKNGTVQRLTFRDLGTQIRFEQSLLANARMSLMDDVGKASVGTRQAAYAGGFDATMMHEIRKVRIEDEPTPEKPAPKPPVKPTRNMGTGIRRDLRNATSPTT